MRRKLVLGVAILTAAVACAEPPDPPTSPDLKLLLSSEAVPTNALNFTTSLSGDEEVPPRDTRARGAAIFHVNEDGTAIEYKLIVANIRNVVAAHIHLGPPDCNCPVVAFLYGNEPPAGGRLNGVIAEGTITGADLIGPLAGQPLSALIQAMRDGNTYVNVHTNDGVAPPNTGPGDFPGGEIRGHLDGGHVN